MSVSIIDATGLTREQLDTRVQVLAADPTVDDLIDALLAEADGLNARLDALLASPMNAAGQQGRLWPPNPPGVHSQ